VGFTRAINPMAKDPKLGGRVMAGFSGRSKMSL
jgi:hypothetical protein